MSGLSAIERDKRKQEKEEKKVKNTELELNKLVYDYKREHFTQKKVKEFIDKYKPSSEMTLFFEKSLEQAKEVGIADHMDSIVKVCTGDNYRYLGADASCPGYCHRAKEGETFTCSCVCCY